MQTYLANVYMRLISYKRYKWGKVFHLCKTCYPLMEGALAIIEIPKTPETCFEHVSVFDIKKKKIK